MLSGDEVAGWDLDDRMTLAEGDDPVDDGVLAVLAGDSSAWVRQRVAAGRRALPERVAAALARDPSIQVRAALAGASRDLSDDVVGVLSADEQAQVRTALARSACRLPDHVVRALAEDTSPRTRITLLEAGHDTSPALVADVVTVGEKKLRERAVAAVCALIGADVRHWNRTMSSDGVSGQVRAWIAAATDDGDMIEQAVTDADPQVRAAVAQNRHLTDEQRLNLLGDEDAGVRGSVLADAGHRDPAVRARFAGSAGPAGCASVERQPGATVIHQDATNDRMSSSPVPFIAASSTL